MEACIISSFKETFILEKDVVHIDYVLSDKDLGLYVFPCVIASF